MDPATTKHTKVIVTTGGDMLSFFLILCAIYLLNENDELRKDVLILKDKVERLE
jgi:hypothetical protein